jgi:hypothetical protein
VKFSFLRISRSAVALGVTVLIAGVLTTPAALAQSTSGQQPSGQQPAGQQSATGQTTKNYKDRGEYDLYVQVTQATDPQKRLQLLNTWSDKYPQTDYEKERLQYYLATLNQLAATDPSARKQLIDKAQQMLKLDPNNFTANYYIATAGPSVGGANPPPDLLSQVETAAHGMLDNIDNQFAPDKKPANMSADQWTQAKTVATALAHNTLAWTATSKKDTAGAEEQYKQSLQANPNQPSISYAYAKLLMNDKKYPEALFEYARAASYDGQGALPQAARNEILAYFNKVYGQYHGNADGADQVLAQAKTNALPPDGFNIQGQGDIEAARQKAIQDRMNSDPAFKLWYTIKTNLTGDQGDQFFNSNVKDAEIPGGAEGVKTFSGTVISIDPPDHPTKVVVGVEDPQTPDATLLFSKPLPTSALDKIKVGQKLDFSGVADSYAKDPYMLTFKDPSIPGVETTPAPAKRPTTHRRTTPHSK